VCVVQREQQAEIDVNYAATAANSSPTVGSLNYAPTAKDTDT